MKSTREITNYQPIMLANLLIKMFNKSSKALRDGSKKKKKKFSHWVSFIGCVLAARILEKMTSHNP